MKKKFFGLALGCCGVGVAWRKVGERGRSIEQGGTAGAAKRGETTKYHLCKKM